jgi:CheY-like chemotaxis protein
MIRSLAYLSLAAALLSQCAMASAQQPPSPPKEGGPPAGASAPVEALAPETNPAVLAALELPRTEPKHYLEAVLALVNLKRPELAAPILKELVDLKLDQDQLADLVDEFGSHRLLELAHTAALAPAASEFADAAMTAAATRARDPQRVAKLIADLSSPSTSVRNAARYDLAAAGEPGVVAALEALARETNPRHRQAIAAAMVTMDPTAVNPLLGMLSTDDPALRRDVIGSLKAMRVTLAQAFVVGATSPASAERLLDDAIGRTKRGMRAFATDQDDAVAVWRWDDAAKKLTATRYPIAEAQIVWSARLALEYVRLRPAERLAQCQALVLGLEADAITSGRPSPAIVKLLAAADGDMLNMVLNAAMKHELPRAAVAAAKTLGKRGDAGVLTVVSPNTAPLADALKYPDRRVRFTALSAIMTLDPPAPFPGASLVPETLGYFATGAAQRRAVVAMPVAEHATSLAGRLAGLNVEADPSTRGGAAITLAQQSSDLEMVLVDMDIDGPGIRDVLYSLRAEPATGQIPIGLLATGDRLDAAHRLASQHQRVVAFPRPQSDAALADLVARLGEVGGGDTISPQDRAAMAGQALAWLGELLARDHTFYDLHRQAPVVTAALYMPAMTERAVAALALLGTPESQRSLVDFASHLSVPVAAREQAARAFATSVQRHGILLTEAEILRQYDLYNASQSLDAATQQVFASLLDSIESLRAQADVGRTHPASFQP